MHVNPKQTIFVLLLLGMASISHAVVPANGYMEQTGQAVGVMVKMRNDPTPLAIAMAGGQPRLSAQTVAELSVVAAADLTYKRTMSGGAHVLSFSSTLPVADAQAIADRLMTMPAVAYATPNLVIKPMLDPDDPRYQDGSQWALNGSIAGANLPTAWDTTTGVNKSVTVAVLDTGYTEHSDLISANFATDGYDFISDTTEAGDGDGRDSNARDEGDICSTDTTPKSSWHGTSVMSVIGAKTNNASLMAGVNWNAKLIPVRVLGRCGGTDADLIDGIRWAAGLHVAGVTDNANPAKVINMSLGGVGTCDNLLQSAIDDAYHAGALLVAAAGNSAIKASTTAPANCNNVLAIAAHTESGDIASFSNYGDPVALSAPGVSILLATCSNIGAYSSACNGSTTLVKESGTSFSAPMVSGVASLLFAESSTVNNVYVGAILKNSARAFVTNSACINHCGSGMLDAAAAVALVKNFSAPAKQIQISKDSGGGAVQPGFWLGLGLFVWFIRRIRYRADNDNRYKQTS